jgi:Plasmid stabilization system protein
MRKIVLLPIAVRDLEDIVDYLGQFYESVAIEQYDRIIEKINELAEFPEMYGIFGDGSFLHVYRRMPVNKYLVFHVVRDEIIEIHRILHGSRDVHQYLDQI